MSKVKENAYEPEVEYYFNLLKDYKKLTSEEERELAKEIQKGNHQALNTLVEHNLRFVVNIAKGYRNRGVLFSDIIAEGNLGLIRAAQKFDPDKDNKFISYAVWWIRCYINDYINKQTNTNEISTDDYLQYQYREDQINEEFEDNLNLLSDRKSTIADLLMCLKDRERKVIQMAFGLNGEKEMTLDEISKITDLSMERIRQIKDTAIMKMKCEVLMRPSDEFKELKTLY